MGVSMPKPQCIQAYEKYTIIIIKNHNLIKDLFSEMNIT